MMKLLNALNPIKKFVAICVIGFVIFLVASMNGHKLLGDDNATKESSYTSSSSRGGSNRFYHK